MPRAVCCDKYGENDEPRHDDILIKTEAQGNSYFIFAKLLLLFRFKDQELCYVQLYENVTPGSYNHPILNEQHIQLSTRKHMYYYYNNCFILFIYFLIL